MHVHKQTGDLVIRGLPFARNRNVDGRLPRKQNEVCLILEIDADDARPDEEQALVQIGPEDIEKKRFLTNTNKSFPHCRFDEQAYATRQQREEQAPLACRWKMRAEYKDISERRSGHTQSLLILEHFSERDGYKIKKRNLGVDEERARERRGETIPGGSTFREPEFNSAAATDSKPIRIQQYSFAEICAGAGGASRGAERAGFKVVLGVETCPHACSSFRANFPNAELYEMKVTDLDAKTIQTVVDLLHLSPSAFDGVGDDPEAANKRCKELLEVDPRFVSMEQPAAIMSERQRPFLHAIIRSFTEAGYSVQYKMVQMADYGLPQMRKRFILIAAGPGEKLPKWPTPTHSSSPTGGQQPLFTEKEAIEGLTPELHSLHDPDSLPTIKNEARDADQPINSPINGNGSVYHHADGERDFTQRELACLQGFPTCHQFEGSYIKKQIANAFPPLIAMAFYQHLRQHMEEVDGVQPSFPEPGEPSGDSTASLPEISNDDTMEDALNDESPNGPLDADMADALPNAPAVAIPDAPADVVKIEQPFRSPIQPETIRDILYPSLPMSPTSPTPGLTMSPETVSDGEPSSPASHTPAPVQQLPTPSTNERFVNHQSLPPIGLKRGRALFEEPGSDGDDDDAGPETLQTPSKRPRLLIAGDGTDDRRSEGSRTASRSPDDGNDVVEDVPMSEKVGEARGSSPDDEMVDNLAREL